VTVDTELCGREALVQTVQVNTGTLGLRHVVVSVKGISSPIHDGIGPKRIIVNAKCAFEPRVAAGRVGDTLEIQNLDLILHNTHVVVGKKTIVNVAQVAGSRPIPKTLKRAGLYVLRCDKHTFMTGALQVFDHPYFAVTDEFGAFQLPPLPAGHIPLWFGMKRWAVLNKRSPSLHRECSPSILSIRHEPLSFLSGIKHASRHTSTHR
jgi:plastocyanin